MNKPTDSKSLVKAIEKEEKAKFKKRFKYLAIITATIILAVIVILLFLNLSSIGPKSGMHTLQDIPQYDGKPYALINGNKPGFDVEAYSSKVFETYSELDYLGRCGPAFANVCKEIMPTEDRKSIGQIKPSGWNQAKYPGVVNSDPPYLFNRCHLIAFQLAGENDNEKNLITGTRSFNVEGMLPFENEVREYIDETNNHVLYRVTPVFVGTELVTRGVIIEAWSVEDRGKGISFNVFVFNVQPGIEIDYSDGSSKVVE